MIKAFTRRIKWNGIIAYLAFATVAGVGLGYLESVDDIEPTFSILAFIYFSMLIYWGVRWIVGQLKSLLRERKDKMNMELKHLQSQINPHFFFNTLNNLYGLVEKDGKQAQQLILKLSDLMRYSIYDGQHEQVMIKEEIAYIKQYIDLHRMRYHKKIDVHFNTQIEDETLTILPLMFISLLENAFKHGVENLRSDAYVYVDVVSLGGSLLFKVVNNFDPEELSDDPGIGLENLKRRLQIAYPKNHTLNISKEHDVFTAELKITGL